ncbi:Glutathione S-transferase T3 [Cardamine amara subsp. amara]|uniref:Glutathione S-transferase T3 n=1 Tax=Cardamine amara subsp. amara TaxID=228776 RepID=A0ABD1C7U2_CARAN
MDSTNPFSHSSGFMNLLNNQQENPSLEPNPYGGFSPIIELGSSEVSVFNSQCTDDPILGKPTPEGRKERRNWSPKEDILLISAWLNTSKDPVVGNEQRAAAFWTRIAAYFNSSVRKNPELAGIPSRDHTHCKQRWQRINDQVCKFVGCYEAAHSTIKSGWSDEDYKKLALDLFFSDHKNKFTLEHAWLELRHDQKWCGEGSSKRKNVEEASTQSSNSFSVGFQDDEPLGRPAGVKASKAKGKRSLSNRNTVAQESKDMLEFQDMWAIKEKDLRMKDKLSDKKLLDSLLLKTEPLTDMELALKNKLISDMLSN